VIVPARNEEEYIERCLDSLLNQRYERNAYEIIVVNGMSEDNTKQLILNYMHQTPNIFLLDNPHRYTSYALNLGIKTSQGDVIIILGAHSFARPDFIEANLRCLQKTGADCVGGPIETIGETFVARAIALAMSSPFGVGNALFRYSHKEGYVDTVSFGAYPRAVFKKVGLFDETFIRDQDDEFNYRLRKAGGKIFITPKIRSSYYSRASLRKLWLQYFEYGYWKVRVLQKHPRMFMVRQLVPLAFVSSLILSTALGIFNRASFLVFLLVLASYLTVSLAVSLVLSCKRGWNYFPILPLVFGCLHLSYGLGFLSGLVRFGIGGRLRQTR
jgi:cellulose synthase/poly-beta-1,6-N-acetylglucosamine synthase-like glycosyltransferase